MTIFWRSKKQNVKQTDKQGNDWNWGDGWHEDRAELFTLYRIKMVRDFCGI